MVVPRVPEYSAYRNPNILLENFLKRRGHRRSRADDGRAWHSALAPQSPKAPNSEGPQTLNIRVKGLGYRISGLHPQPETALRLNRLRKLLVSGSDIIALS